MSIHAHAAGMNPTTRLRSGTDTRFGEYPFERFGFQRRSTFASPVLPPLSDNPDDQQMLTGRHAFDMQAELFRWRIENPIDGRTGVHGPASMEYSARRSAEVLSCASKLTSAPAPARFADCMRTTGGVLSISTGELTRSDSFATAGGLAIAV